MTDTIKDYHESQEQFLADFAMAETKADKQALLNERWEYLTEVTKNARSDEVTSK